MRFVKMQGCGNDYVHLDGFRERLPEDLPALARRISDRHLGVGADGLIAVLPPSSPQADARMRMWNADGSEAEMCGNGLRCVGKLLYESGLVRKERLRVETGAGVLDLALHVTPDGRVPRVRAVLGTPRLHPAEIPVDLPGERALDVPLEAGGRTFRAACLSLGNPHAVIFLDSVEAFPVERYGPELERHPLFPRRTNVEFAEVRSRREVRQRTWERGAGETLACGTGACAVAVAGILRGLLESPVTVRLNGGDLGITWTPGGAVEMEGPAETVFTGDFPV